MSTLTTPAASVHSSTARALAPIAVAAPPRLLLFTRDDPACSTGGVETFTARLLALFPGSEAVAYGGAAGARRLLNEARDARAARTNLLERIAAMRPTVIVANGAAAWALPRLEVPHIVVYHGTYAGFGRAITPVARWRGRIAKSYGAWMERRAARHAEAVVAVSASVAEQARRYYGVGDRLAVIENGGAADEAMPRDRGDARRELALPASLPLLLFVGRGDATKGFDALIELARHRPTWRIAAAGVAPQRGWPRNLQALGVLTPTALSPWRAAADLVLLPSCYEGCSYALIEALAADRPIVTTATGCFTEPGTHPYGVVVRPRGRLSAAAFATTLEQAVERVLARPGDFEPHAATLERFGFARFAREWSAVIDEVARHGC
ncbi:MAG: glycosyltransferase [Planctomycetes bacterium]|nr:glycosyltransferase [Planctomycetota bacterium]